MQRPVWPRALHLALGSAAEDDRPHLPRCESLCSSRRAIGQWPLSESPFCAACMLVRPDDGGIDHHVLEIWSVPKTLKRLSQIPFFDQRLNRTNTLFQCPNAS